MVQGLGGGALLSTAQATLFEAFPPKEVGIGQAMFGVGVMVGPTIGPTLGGYIVDNLSWPWIFYINVPLGIIAAFMVWTYVHDSEHQERADTIDGTGILLLALCVGSLQWMLERGERYDWFDSRFVTMLAHHVADVVRAAHLARADDRRAGDQLPRAAQPAARRRREDRARSSVSRCTDRCSCCRCSCRGCTG